MKKMLLAGMAVLALGSVAHAEPCPWRCESISNGRFNAANGKFSWPWLFTTNRGADKENSRVCSHSA